MAKPETLETGLGVTFAVCVLGEGVGALTTAGTFAGWLLVGLLAFFPHPHPIFNSFK
jgi:hypothetical protein